MVEAYWKSGKRIVEEEQGGKDRAAYGKAILKNLSHALTEEFGRGFSERTLREIRQFYHTFPSIGELLSLDNEKQRTAIANSENEKWRTIFAKLNWTHFQRVLKVKDEQARYYYLKEAAEQNWSIGTLDRNISTLFYQRLLSSQTKDELEQEMKNKTKIFQNDS